MALFFPNPMDELQAISWEPAEEPEQLTNFNLIVQTVWTEFVPEGVAGGSLGINLNPTCQRTGTFTYAGWRTEFSCNREVSAGNEPGAHVCRRMVITNETLGETVDLGAWVDANCPFECFPDDSDPRADNTYSNSIFTISPENSLKRALVHTEYIGTEIVIRLATFDDVEPGAEIEPIIPPPFPETWLSELSHTFSGYLK